LRRYFPWYNNTLFNSDVSHLPYKPDFLEKLRYISIIESKDYNYNFPKFKIKPVSLSMVKSAYRRIKSTAKGNDNISINLVNPILSFILPALTHIINHCILFSVYPDVWQHGLVVPLPKIKNPNNSDDLRPICILTPFSKVLEHLVIDQLDQYIEENNLIYQFQSGFRKQHSTTTALIKISDDIRSAKDNHEVTFMILLDFSKAFNCIDFDILAIKMFKYFNFSEDAVLFFVNFLKNRKQCTVLNGNKSQFIELLGGVPQGTVSGPKLFNLYINDLHLVVSNCKVLNMLMTFSYLFLASLIN
jgi:hypothetical protein